MASALISQLYEAINAQGTDIVGADSGEYPCCLLAFEIAIEDWDLTSYFEMEIQVPSSFTSSTALDGQACLVSIDGSNILPIYADYCEISVYETSPNEYSVIFNLFVERSTMEGYDGTFVFALCSFAQFIQQGQLGLVTTTPANIPETIGLTTSLDNPYAPPATPLATPTGLNATNVTSNSARISWNAVENASGYKVEYRRQGDTTWNE